MDTIFRHAVVLVAALALTWIIFFGASYFGAVWTHYFAGAPSGSTSNTGEVSVKIINTTPYAGRSCDKDHACAQQPKPHD